MIITFVSKLRYPTFRGCYNVARAICRKFDFRFLNRFNDKIFFGTASFNTHFYQRILRDGEVKKKNEVELTIIDE